MPLGVVAQTTGRDRRTRLDLHRNDGIADLRDEVNLVARLVARPIARCHVQLGKEGLKRVVLCKRSLELQEEGILLGKRRGRKPGKSPQEPHIEGVQLKGGGVIIGGKRDAMRGVEANPREEAGVTEPLDGILVLAGTCPIPRQAPHELLVFSCELCRKGIPDQRELNKLAATAVLCEVALIGVKKIREQLIDLKDILMF